MTVQSRSLKERNPRQKSPTWVVQRDRIPRCYLVPHVKGRRGGTVSNTVHAQYVLPVYKLQWEQSVFR